MLRVIAQKWGDNLCFLWGQSDWFCQQRQGGFEKTDFFSSVLFPQINELCQCCHACRYNMWSCSFVVSQAMCLTLCCRRTSGIDERRLTQTMASFIREKLYVAQHQVISIQILSNPIYRLEKKKKPIQTHRSWLDSTDNVQSLYKQLLMTAEHKYHKWMYLKEVWKFGLTNFALN